MHREKNLEDRPKSAKISHLRQNNAYLTSFRLYELFQKKPCAYEWDPLIGTKKCRNEISITFRDSYKKCLRKPGQIIFPFSFFPGRSIEKSPIWWEFSWIGNTRGGEGLRKEEGHLVQDSTRGWVRARVWHWVGGRRVENRTFLFSVVYSKIPHTIIYCVLLRINWNKTAFQIHIFARIPVN